MSRRKGQPVTMHGLITALGRIGYKVTNQSTDGSWKLLRLPDGTPTDYWIFEDHIEHQIGDSRGGSYFHFKDCELVVDGDETVAIVCTDSPTSSVFVQFHNFKSHRKAE